MAGMYKTVRQGDASLQYTILPQIDEFHVHDVSSVRGSPPVKGHHCPSEDRIWLPSSRLLCFMLSALVIVITITCCIMATYVINAMIRGPCAITTSQPTVPMTKEVLITKDGRNDEDEKEEAIGSTTMTSSNTLDVSRMLTDNQVLVSSSRSSTLSPTPPEVKEPGNFEFTITEMVSPSPQDAYSTSHSSSTGRTSTSTSSPLDVAAESSDSRASIIEAPTNNIVNILRKLKMLKMPRVTLKLRINDTIPQMYMKAGIASYKKGKITTSVLAQGLSLEGLIFKTPEGTIKPWRESWPFADNSDIFQRKRIRMMWQDPFFATLLLMIGIMLIALGLIRVVKRRFRYIQEAEVECKDETRAILFDVQTRDPEDKA